MELTINGERRVCPDPGDRQLLDYLRQDCGLTALKDGCSGDGSCGICTALVNGVPKFACVTPLAKLAGAEVITPEGIDARHREYYAAWFARHGAFQCGFCTPGFVSRVHALVLKDQDLDRAQIAKQLAPVICRCTGYIKIFDALEDILRHRAQLTPPELDLSGRVGGSLPVDGYEGFVDGSRRYTADLRFPGMLYGRVRLADIVHGRVLSIDTREALAAPGVVAVVTGRDIPGRRTHGLLNRDWPVFVGEGEGVNYSGDIIAAVAACTPGQAETAATLIRVRYQEERPILTVDEALAASAPLIYEHGGSNVMSESVVLRGDIARGEADSAHIVEAVFHTQRIEHAYLEPENCVALPDGRGGLKVYSQGQGIYDDQAQIAAVLDLPQERVEVELVPSGGAFGGKEDLTIQSQAALLAWRARAPVSLSFSRGESIRVHAKRHPLRLEYRAGCDARGQLTFIRARIYGDKGAYASVGCKVLERAAGHACGPYKVPHVDVRALAVATHNPPGGAMRGFGANQAAFAIEGIMDLLAEKAGIDPFEIRWRNAVEVGDVLATGQRLEESVGLKKCMEVLRPIYEAHRGRVGLAVGLKNTGLGNGAPDLGYAVIEVQQGGRLRLYTSYMEMGQGLFTILKQVASEVTGLSPTIMDVTAHTRFDLSVGQTTGSRGSLLGGMAMQDAARKLRAALDGGVPLASLVGECFRGAHEVRDCTKLGHVNARGQSKIHIAYGFACQLCILDDQGRIERIVAAHDVGRALNRNLCVGQIQGSVHMGLGYALTEELAMKDGRPEERFGRLGLIKAHKMPKVDVILIEDPSREGPFGAKGVGELGLVPTAPAVRAALKAYDGVFRTSLPMKDSAAARALR